MFRARIVFRIHVQGGSVRIGRQESLIDFSCCLECRQGVFHLIQAGVCKPLRMPCQRHFGIEGGRLREMLPRRLNVFLSGQRYTQHIVGQPAIRIGLAQAQLATKNYQGAIKTINPVLIARPGHPALNYFRALAAYQAKDYETVTVHTENILKFDRGNLPTILIAGAARFALGQYERAASDLERFVSQVPTHEPARRLLGAVQLKLQKPKEALGTLKSVAEKENADVALLSLIGTASVAPRRSKNETASQ